ncbi:MULTISPECIES: LuxR C-terminal-related transcriptional regulator [unclassified Nocardioides]|uniref:LuxR C-terminal-related transcriptional regulator n=1 Tax=unclassified Nocardioides TaxID=2615069 RepID=UPI0006F5F067|nr:MULTISPECIES: LuxR C-terminal-related transcriptional regulator [unclassified Nocardioides]KQY63478.1 hypothetical protein ASD30_00165 [Nocardioides sp. Root140]KRF17570.1 hypothetical protein ASH02_25265 [Nocardioides sp. Soil796]
MPSVLKTSSNASDALERALSAALTTSGLPVVFAGRVRSGALRISRLRGNRCEALKGLALPPDVGLGGKAVTIGRPVSVRDYASALAISHEYDAAVAREGLRSMVAVPVRVHGDISAVLYGGVRAPVAIGDRAINELVALSHQLGYSLEQAASAPVADSVSARVAQGPGRVQWCTTVEGMLSDLSGEAAPLVHDEARRTCVRLLAVMRGDLEPARPPLLSSREREVLALAAAGCSDLDIAEDLGLDVVAVRTAVRGLRRAFGVRSRHAAVSAARSSGVLP